MLSLLFFVNLMSTCAFASYGANSSGFLQPSYQIRSKPLFQKPLSDPSVQGTHFQDKTFTESVGDHFACLQSAIGLGNACESDRVWHFIHPQTNREIYLVGVFEGRKQCDENVKQLITKVEPGFIALPGCGCMMNNYYGDLLPENVYMNMSDGCDDQYQKEIDDAKNKLGEGFANLAEKAVKSIVKVGTELKYPQRATPVTLKTASETETPLLFHGACLWKTREAREALGDLEREHRDVSLNDLAVMEQNLGYSHAVLHNQPLLSVDSLMKTFQRENAKNAVAIFGLQTIPDIADILVQRYGFIMNNDFDVNDMP